MSGSRRNAVPVVCREYRNAPDDCARALALLLNSTVSKKGGIRAAPDDAERNLSDGARNIIQDPK
jgi:hypothetical protein